MDAEAILKQNLAEVEDRIQAACRRAGRARSDVQLVAVTKYVDVNTARLLLNLGVTDLGESRPQELWKKAEALRAARWHLVGHLQTNKIERTLPLVQLIHSVDSDRLLMALEKTAQRAKRAVDVLIEVNLTGALAKHGFALVELETIADLISSLEYVRVKGLMTMADLEDDPEKSRPVFAQLRKLRDELQVPGLKHLSMGMTNDFEVAIEEGATMVRIGSALFKGLEGASP